MLATNLPFELRKKKLLTLILMITESKKKYHLTRVLSTYDIIKKKKISVYLFMTGLKLARLALSCLALKYKQQEEQLNHRMCRVTFFRRKQGTT